MDPKLALNLGLPDFAGFNAHPSSAQYYCRGGSRCSHQSEAIWLPDTKMDIYWHRVGDCWGNRVLGYSTSLGEVTFSKILLGH
jgi:hypothetical protein